MNLDPGTYARWRATDLGRITERLEVELVCSLADLRAGQRVLDVGTGDGTYAIEAARRGASVVGLDTSAAMLAAAEARARAEGHPIDVRLGSVTALPLRTTCPPSVAQMERLQVINRPRGLSPNSVNAGPKPVMRDGAISSPSRKFVPILSRTWRFPRQPFEFETVEGSSSPC